MDWEFFKILILIQASVAWVRKKLDRSAGLIDCLFVCIQEQGGISVITKFLYNEFLIQLYTGYVSLITQYFTWTAKKPIAGEILYQQLLLGA